MWKFSVSILVFLLSFNLYSSIISKEISNSISETVKDRCGFTSKEQLEALLFYTVGDYEELNSQLRRGGLTKALKRIKKNLLKALEKLPSVKRKVYRGSCIRPKYFNLKDKIYTDKAFISTSEDKSVAIDFIEMGEDCPKKKSFLFQITPKKANSKGKKLYRCMSSIIAKLLDDEELGLFPEHIASSRVFEDLILFPESEREVLFPAGQKFIVKGYEEKSEYFLVFVEEK